MARIIIGTTPTIRYRFKNVDTSRVVQAFMTIKYEDGMLKKSLADAEVGEGVLSWHLTQEDTLSVGEKNATIMCNTLLDDGTRTSSASTSVIFIGNHIPEVIS